jgi:hypothetical protein
MTGLPLFLATAAAAAIVACTAPPATTSQSADTTAAPVATTDLTAVVYKDPNCGCCNDWVTHLRDNGFTVVARDVRDLDAVKQRHGIPRRLHSCHTAEIGGYVVEGHVPADLVRRLLRERPAVAGIAVPGMPVGSPGMEGPYSEPYEIVAFTRAGATSVYATR